MSFWETLGLQWLAPAGTAVLASMAWWVVRLDVKIRNHDKSIQEIAADLKGIRGLGVEALQRLARIEGRLNGKPPPANTGG